MILSNESAPQNQDLQMADFASEYANITLRFLSTVEVTLSAIQCTAAIDVHFH